MKKNASAEIRRSSRGFPGTCISSAAPRRPHQETCNRSKVMPLYFLSSTKSEWIIYRLRMSRIKEPKWGQWKNTVEKRNDSIIQKA